MALAIVVGAAVGGALVEATFTALPTRSCGNPDHPGLGPGPLPEFGPPDEHTVGSGYWYNSTVESVGVVGMTLGNLQLEITLQNGSAVAPGPGWTLNVVNASGVIVGTYAMTGAAAGSWTSGAGALLWNTQLFSLFSAADRLYGDTWVVIVAHANPDGCPVSGSVSLEIP